MSPVVAPINIGGFRFIPNANPITQAGTLLDNISQAEVFNTAIQSRMTDQVVTGRGDMNSSLNSQAKTMGLLGLFHTWYHGAIELFKSFLQILSGNQSLSPAGK